MSQNFSENSGQDFCSVTGAPQFVRDYLPSSNYLVSVQQSVHNNVKHFWNYINYKDGSNTLPDLMLLGDVEASSPPDIANLFAQHFASVFSPPSPVPPSYPQLDFCCLGMITVSESDVERELLSLDPDKGAGPDGLPPVLLRSCADILVAPLSALFNLSLSSGSFPHLWKASYVTPIHKAGDRAMIDHYRPICTLSTIPKMLERLVLLPLQRALSPFLAAGQHGFLGGRSTVTNLLEFQEYALCGVAGGCQVDLVSTDFAKAFDRLSHHHILAKLDSVGVHGALLAWFSGYLSDRSLVVRIKGALSAPFLASSGVPQGSHIGPLLFLLVIDSVVEMFEGLPVLLFADDLKVFSRVGSARDCRRIQAALDRLSDWCGQNSLYLNPSKCSIVSFYRSDSFTCFDYHISGIALNRLTSVVDLGILFDSRLTMTDHINRISARAMKTLGFLKRNTRDFQDIPALVTLYRSLVVPTLEYGSVVWSPYVSL
ncbi:WD repeat domain 59 [Nesidiocoris tenuis]|uniref:WD repeat domain 59 n=1 Tax=Nesidiocoris tenuis TaxID=355587 RepID=A0ABN7AY55_9HEMI|nr:WD repeat domain 59 [Nesidiocoris tenuis]